MSKLFKQVSPFAVLSALLPLAASAQSVEAILKTVGTTLRTVIALLFVVATVVFLWGVIQFIANAGNEEKRKKAKNIMTWGIVGLAVMAAAWGITTILIDYFKIPGQGPVPTPVPRPTFQ